MHDTAWRPHPPFEDELPPGYSWSSYPDAFTLAFPDDDAPVLFPLPVADNLIVSHEWREQAQAAGGVGTPLAPEPSGEPLRLCILLGTPGAGKTTLAAAWGRPTPSTVVGAPIVTPDDSLRDWMQAADGNFRDPGRPAATRLRDVGLRVQPAQGNPAQWTLREASAEVFGNGSHAPTRSGAGLLSPPTPAQGWTSMALVLCIDGAQPQSELWQRVLPRQIESWSTATVGDTQGRLPFDRVLLLLTRVDRFCARACGAAQRGPGAARKALAGMKPEGLAMRLDPTQQVRAVLGDDLVGRLLSALKPGAATAAGLACTLGFGGTQVAPQALPPWSTTTWKPVGVREAFRFIDGGASSFPLAPLTADDLKRELVTLTR